MARTAIRAAVFPDGMRLQINDYVYPDASVVVGGPQFREGPKRRVLPNPSVVVEVLSESTAAYDRGENYALYREVRPLREVVWVDSEHRSVEVAVKADGAWSIREPVGDLYRGVGPG